MKNNKDFLPDYKAFKKDAKEQAKAKTAKAAWKRNMKLFYGDDWKNHNNYPFTLSDV